MPYSERIETLERKGFRIVKQRSLKSGEHYKITLPKALKKIHPACYTRIGLDYALEFAEGMLTVWEAVQREIERDIGGLAGKFGVEMKTEDAQRNLPDSSNLRINKRWKVKF